MSRRKSDCRQRFWMMCAAGVVLFSLAAYQLNDFARFNEFATFDMMLSEQLLVQETQQQQQVSASQTEKDASATIIYSTTSTVTQSLHDSVSILTTTTEASRIDNGFSFYYPKIRDAAYFANDPWTQVPYMHVLETPLIQNQLNLTLLIESRLELFEAFCLPSMKQQTSRDFIWIVRVDTRLSSERPHWLRRLIELLANDERFYLIERDSNPPWRNGESSKQLKKSKVYTGNQRRLEYYMTAHEEKHIFETRIDGDDGLHYQYMQYIAQESMKILAQNPPPAFFFWCVVQEMEWHPVIIERRPGPFLETNVTPIEPLPPSPYTHGLWMPGPVYNDLCPTPGVTRVYPLGTPTEQVFRIGHHELWRKFKYRKASCERPQDGPLSPWKELNCTPIVQLGSPFPALRTRTPTSASMVTVGGLNYGHLRTHYQQAHVYWNLTAHDFGLDPNRMQQMQTHVVNHLLEIAQEGLEGQCSFRHSCMENARKRLVEIIRKANQTRAKQAG